MRIPRTMQLYPGAVLHLYWRCTDHHNQYLLKSDAAKRSYISWVLALKDHYGIKIFSYCAMDNHYHVILQISDIDAFRRFLQHAHTAFAKQLNGQLKRTGAVIQNRVRLTVVEDEAACLVLESYVALNRWNCEARVKPEDYMFSSYRHYAGIEHDPRLDVSPGWLAMGNNDKERCLAYREMVEARRQESNPVAIDAIEQPMPYFGRAEFVKERTSQLREAMKAHREKRAELRTHWARSQESLAPANLSDAERKKN